MKETQSNRIALSWAASCWDMGDGQLSQTETLLPHLSLKAPGDSRRLLSGWKLLGGHLFPSKKVPHTAYLWCQELKEIMQDFPMLPEMRASCFGCSLYSWVRKLPSFPKHGLRQHSGEHKGPIVWVSPFEEDTCMLALLGAPCPAERGG